MGLTELKLVAMALSTVACMAVQLQIAAGTRLQKIFVDGSNWPNPFPFRSLGLEGQADVPEHAGLSLSADRSEVSAKCFGVTR